MKVNRRSRGAVSASRHSIWGCARPVCRRNLTNRSTSTYLQLVIAASKVSGCGMELLAFLMLRNSVDEPPGRLLTPLRIFTAGAVSLIITHIRCIVDASIKLLMDVTRISAFAPSTPKHLGRPSAFSFSQALAEPGNYPLLSPTRYVDLLKIDINTFATHTHVHQNTVSRAPGAASVQDYLRKNLRVLTAAYDASGQDAAEALHWFRNEPLAQFGYKTAEQLVSDGRADDALNLIESYAADDCARQY